MYKVELTYFKPNGKLYAKGEYESQKESLSEIFDEVERMWDRRQLPDLTKGHGTFITLIEVPDHPNGYPHLVGVYDLTE